MTTVAVLADPPREGLVLTELAATTPLSEAEAADLYSAMLRDVCRAVEDSGGDLLVNYRADEDLPAAEETDQSAEATVRAAVKSALADFDEARFEVQVGSSLSARAGNTVTHLLEREEVKTAAVVEPTAAFLTRQLVDNAAMKLRRNDIVLGPAPEGRVYYAGFGEPVDFEDAFAPPALETLASRGADADLAVDFLPITSPVETRSDLVTALSYLEAHDWAERHQPEHTASVLAEVGVDVQSGDEGLELARE